MSRKAFVTNLSLKSHRNVSGRFYYIGLEQEKEAHGMEFLKVDNLCKVYGRGENQVTALDHVSLTIEKKKFAAIIGSSGSGKSTLLHAIAGVDVPTGGKVYLNGQDVYAHAMRSLPFSADGRLV